MPYNQTIYRCITPQIYLKTPQLFPFFILPILFHRKFPPIHRLYFDSDQEGYIFVLVFNPLNF
jgi:hypothetical protein